MTIKIQIDIVELSFGIADDLTIDSEFSLYGSVPRIESGPCSELLRMRKRWFRAFFSLSRLGFREKLVECFSLAVLDLKKIGLHLLLLGDSGDLVDHALHFEV